MTNDIAHELAKLHELRGKQFVRQLEKITLYGGFHLIKGEVAIYSVGGEHDDDFENLMAAAHKAVEQGNQVYLLPNPKNVKTADFIFEKKGAYKMYDLKTVHGKASIETQLLDSMEQSNRILLHMTADYNARLLASDIKSYFEKNADAVEVLIYKGKKVVSVNRYSALNPMFYKQFRKRYEK